MKFFKFFLLALTTAAIFQFPLRAQNLELDANGWTVLNPSADSRKIYVSSSEGNDLNDGLSASTPKRTIANAFVQMRDGYPDWMLFKSGDVFTETIQLAKSGRSAAEPMVFTQYGLGSRPKFTNKDGVIGGISAVHYLAIVGLHLTGELRNDPLPCPAGIRMVTGSWSHILLENNFIEKFAQNIAIDLNDGTAFTVRRNVIVDAYHIGSECHAQGLYMAGVSDVTVEQNIFDHNGWNETIEVRSGLTSSAPTSDTIVLDSGALSYPTGYELSNIEITSGPGADGIKRIISNYGRLWVNANRANTTTTIQLPTTAVPVDQFYNNASVLVIADWHPEAGQTNQKRKVIAYSAANQTITLDSPLPFVPTNANDVIVSGVDVNNSAITMNPNLAHLATVYPAWTTRPTSSSNFRVWGAGPNIFRRNVYIQKENTSLVKFDENIVANSGSEGAQLRTGGSAKNNTFLRNTTGFLFATGGIACSNVVVDSRNISILPGMERGGGIDLSGNNTEIYGNIMTYRSTPAPWNIQAITVNHASSNMNIHDNIVYNWFNQSGSALWIGGSPSNISVHHNDFQQPIGGTAIENLTNVPISFSNNRYHSIVSSPFIFSGNAYNFLNWMSLGQDSNSTLTQVSYPDPNRNVNSYMASIGSTDSTSLDDFMLQARMQSKSNWNPRFTAAVFNDYIRAGFNAPPSCNGTTVPQTFQIATGSEANGTISSGSTNVPAGSNFEVTITANTGFKIGQVVVDGSPINFPANSTSYVYTFANVTANHSIAAKFVPITFTLQVTSGVNGTVTPKTSTVKYGANITVSAVANAGYEIQSFIVDGIAQGPFGATGNYIFMDIRSDHTVFVSFRPIEAPSAKPAAPTNVTAGTMSSSQILLKYSIQTNADVNVIIERSLSAGSNFSVIANLPSSTKSFMNSGLNSNTRYYYRLRAVKIVNGQNIYSAYAPTVTAKTSRR